VSLCERVGEGNFGVVYRAQLDRCSTVAVKMIKGCSDVGRDGVGELLAEMSLMTSLGRHDNVLQLIGCASSDDGQRTRT